MLKVRVLSASLLLASLVVAGGPGTARAQETTTGSTSPASTSDTGRQTGGFENTPPGTVPQPSLTFPGTIAGVTLGELYTDNLTLAADNKPQQTSWITQVQPFFKTAYNGPRFSGLFNYTLTGYLYATQSDHNQLAQDLDAFGTLAVVPQHLFLAGSASYGQQIINNQLPSGSGAFYLDNNRANVGVVSLSPYWTQDLGGLGNMLLRYSAGRVVYNDNGISGESGNRLAGIPNVTSQSVQFNLTSPKYQTWGWNLGYTEQRLQPDYGSEIRFAMAKLGASVEVSSRTRLLADVGKENDFLSSGAVQQLGSSFWDAGVEWSNARDSFKAMVGHRFFGKSYQLSWTHHAALLTTNVSYTEQPTDYNQQLLGMNSGVGSVPIIGTRPAIPSLTDRQPYLSRRLSASAIYTMPHSILSAQVYDERRTYFQINNTEEKVADANLSWLFELGAFTTLTPDFTWRRYQFRDGQVTYTRFGQLVLNHQFNRKNFGSARLRHEENSVYSPVSGAHGYDANVIFVNWTHLLF